MKSMKKHLAVLVVLMLTLIFSSGAYSGEINDADALAGYNQGKIVFDINLTEASKMALYLKVIQQTYNDLERQNINPDIVLAFRGLAVTIIQTDKPVDSPEERKLSDQITKQVNHLQAMGVKMEACSVATGLFEVPNNNILPGIKVVGNTFVSLAGYQKQGYAIIPIM